MDEAESSRLALVRDFAIRGRLLRSFLPPPRLSTFPRPNHDLMGMKVSTIGRSTSADTGTVVPRIPQDIIHEILDHLAARSDFRSLRACALLSKPWVPPCRRHLFYTVTINPRNVGGWFKVFPVPEESPAHHVRDLRVWIGGDVHVLEEFPKHTPWFTNVEKVSFLGYGAPRLSRTRSVWRLSQSVTSLAIRTMRSLSRASGIFWYNCRTWTICRYRGILRTAGRHRGSRQLQWGDSVDDCNSSGVPRKRT